jgi:hypothetical protein
LAHAFEFICYKNEIKATYFIFCPGANGLKIFGRMQSTTAGATSGTGQTARPLAAMVAKS